MFFEQWIRELTRFNLTMKRAKCYQTFTGDQIKIPNIELIEEFVNILSYRSAAPFTLEQFFFLYFIN
jgi:hypothetical protein